jgi:hypothetical protein
MEVTFNRFKRNEDINTYVVKDTKKKNVKEISGRELRKRFGRSPIEVLGVSPIKKILK